MYLYVYLYHFISLVFNYPILGCCFRAHSRHMSAQIPSNWWSTSLPRLDKSYILFMWGFRQYTNLPFQGIFMAHQHHPIFSIQPANDFPCQPPNSRAVTRGRWIHDSISASPRLPTTCTGLPVKGDIFPRTASTTLGSRMAVAVSPQAMVGPWASPVTWRPGNRQWI